MAYTHEFKTRNQQDGVVTFVASGNCSAGTANAAMQVPHGVMRGAFVLRGDTHAKTIVVSVAPYIDPAQTLTGVSFGLLAPANAGTGVAALTLAATATGHNNTSALLMPSRAVQGPGAVYSAYGWQVTISTTAVGGTGTWALSMVVAEA